MERREFMAGLPSIGLSRVEYNQPKVDSKKPNILFILADDLGYGDLGCYGQKQIRTPNLDRLALEGVRFTQSYSGSTVCAPSRCALMTGLHTGHCRIRGNARVPLLPEDTTIPKVLQKAGYRTALFGKWGLGFSGTPGHPNLQGFDAFFGYLDQTHAHDSYPRHIWNDQQEVILQGNMGTSKKEYVPDMFLERSLKFIEENRNHPFFLYFATTIPHANNELGRDTGNGMEVPSDEPYGKENWPQPDKNFAAMVTRLDQQVGQLLDQLHRLGLEENTLIFFTSDNGPHREGGHDPQIFRSSGPLRGIKRDLYDGGIRVPMLVRWPGKTPPGTVSNYVWSFWDVLPTLAAIVGLPALQGLDGISVLPTLLGKEQQEHDYLYWEFHERGFHQAIRQGDWKLVRQGSAARVELYNLKEDLSETQNLAAQYPDRVARLEKLFRSARTESKQWPVPAKQ